MASVVIAGDTSGTCTLQANAAAGTTVLDLPTTSGTLVATGGSPTFTTINATNVIASANSNAAVFTSGLGNATAPAYSFTGDTNTGIFSPTADTIAFTEGGVESMRIDASGNVGVGTASPAFKLDAVVTGNSLNSIIAARNTTSGTAAGSQILVGNDSSNDLLVLRALSSTYTSSGVNTANGSLIRAGGAGGMTLAATDGSGIINFATGGTTEQMRITSAGLLQFNSGYGSVATAYGCRAWVNFNGTGTVAIRASGNVSSITDDGTGRYRVNFTNAMPDINYAANISVSSMPAVSDSNFGIFNDNNGARGDPTTGAIRVSTTNAQFNYIDITYIYVSIFR